MSDKQHSVFDSPPDPNIRLSLGYSVPNVRLTFGDVCNTYFQFYVEKVPNRFQIWMLRVLLGIHMEKL